MNSESNSDPKIIKGDRFFIYFHGNAGNVSSPPSRLEFYRKFTNLDAIDSHVIAIDYRGFGLSQNVTPTEKGLRLDAISTFKYVNEILNIPAKNIYLVGHSLGSGVAVYLAKYLTDEATPPAGLILVAGYTSIPDAAMYYPVSILN